MRLFHFASLTTLDGVVHAVTTRHGGVSAGPYVSLNLGLHVGDSAGAVLENRRRVCEAVGVDVDSLVAGAQVLGNAVAWVTEADRGRGARDQASALPDTDALVTDSPGVVLTAFSADCALIALVDPRRRAIGLAHASRRGTLGHVAARTVRAMERLFGCRPADLVAAIGPSIGPCCYEVGPEVRERETVGSRQEAVGSQQKAGGRRQADIGREQAEVGSEEQSASPSRFFIEWEGKIHFDLWAANVAQLAEAGLAPERIELAGICTRCHADDFFSHRAAGGTTGRFAVLLGLRT